MLDVLVTLPLSPGCQGLVQLMIQHEPALVPFWRNPLDKSSHPRDGSVPFLPGSSLMKQSLQPDLSGVLYGYWGLSGLVASCVWYRMDRMMRESKIVATGCSCLVATSIGVTCS